MRSEAIDHYEIAIGTTAGGTIGQVNSNHLAAMPNGCFSPSTEIDRPIDQSFAINYSGNGYDSIYKA